MKLKNKNELKIDAKFNQNNQRVEQRQISSKQKQGGNVKFYQNKICNANFLKAL